MYKVFKTKCQDTNNEILKIQDALNKNLIPDYFIHSKIINLKIMVLIQVGLGR